jgi:hypothetical protein
MIVQYEAFANISGGRLRGDVVKETDKKVWMIFYPSDCVREILGKQGILPIATKPIERHKEKHKVRRLG